MPLMFTRRLVSSTSSLSSEIKSVPPAKTDASSQSEPRSPRASFSWMVLRTQMRPLRHASFFECAEGREHAVGRERESGRARQWRSRRRLKSPRPAKPPAARRIRWCRAHHNQALSSCAEQFRQCRRCWRVCKIPCRHSGAAGHLIHNFFLEERVGDAHDAAP